MRAISDPKFIFRAVLLGLFSFFCSTLLHYLVPSQFLDKIPRYLIPLVQAFLLTALIEEGVRFVCLHFLKQHEPLKSVWLLMIVALIFSILETSYYLYGQGSLTQIILRLLGALPLHLSLGFLMASIPYIGLISVILIHGFYNYMLLIATPVYMPSLFLLFIVISVILRYKQMKNNLKKSQKEQQISYF
ncbi:MAG: hypothetical protein ACRCVN_02355 [Spirochaetia bacterium]